MSTFYWSKKSVSATTTTPPPEIVTEIVTEIATQIVTETEKSIEMVTHIESVTEIIMETSIGPVEPEAPEARIAHEEEENENELRPGKFCHLGIFLFISFIASLP